jgi:hypothetical protein
MLLSCSLAELLHRASMSLLSAGCSGTFRYVRRQQSSFYGECRCVRLKITLKICVLMYIQGPLSHLGAFF